MLCALIAGAATVLAAGAEYRSRKSARRAEARAARRATESRLAMDLMYATCSLSLTTAKKLAGQHTNGDVEEAMACSGDGPHGVYRLRPQRGGPQRQ